MSTFEDKIKKMILLSIPMSICNFRCHYCYLAQQAECYEGEQARCKYSPEHMAYAMRPERLGGYAYINVCADGETLLTKDLDLYLKPLAEAGHYLEIVSNMTITPMLKKILSWGAALLSHVSFKCSFHYLELQKRGLLDVFAENVQMARNAGASISVEITPSDEMVPYIDEVKKFSMENFGALPQVTIARDDRTNGIDNLTSLPEKEYEQAWSQFDSPFWKYKMTVFGKRQHGFCYAGQWSTRVDFVTGQAGKCYFGIFGNANVFENPDAPWPEEPIGKCPIAHCYNAHLLLTVGNIVQEDSTPRYGDIKDRVCLDGSHWLQPQLKAFFNTRLQGSNREWTEEEKREFLKRKSSFSLKGWLKKRKFLSGKLLALAEPIRQWRGNIWPIAKFRMLHGKGAYLLLSPAHGNLGDHAIAKAAGNFLKAAGFDFLEVTLLHLQNLEKFGRLNIFDGHPIFINGGGNIGTLWPEVEDIMEAVVKSNPHSSVTILPNTCLFGDSPEEQGILARSKRAYNGHADLTIYAREEISYDFMKRHYGNVKLCPDLVLSMNECRDGVRRLGCLLCLRNDKERTMSKDAATQVAALAEGLFPGKVANVDTHIGRNVQACDREAALQAKFEEFRKAELVITDRLHGMVFAAITGTPCIVLNSRSHKVRGCYEWLKNLDYVKCCDDVSRIADVYRSIPTGEHCCNLPELKQYFDALQEDLHKQR